MDQFGLVDLLDAETTVVSPKATASIAMVYEDRKDG